MKNQLKISLNMFWRISTFAMVTGVLLFFTSCRNTNSQTELKTLPVYQVVRSGANDTMVMGLSDKLKIPVKKLRVINGLVSFEDTASFLAIPNYEVKDPALLGLFKERSKNEIKDAPIKYDAIDFNALQKLTVADSATALKIAADAFASSGFNLGSAKPVVRHTTFSASYKGSDGKTASISKQLDTRVNYEFYDKNGYRFTGPGANLNLTFNSDKSISRLHYAWRDLKAGPEVRILSDSDARKRIVKLLPAGAKINMKIVYWCPPFENARAKGALVTIIPWYSFTGTIEKKTKDGRITEVTTKERLIPATDDSTFIPKIHLKIGGERSDRVSASAEVTGGQAPYSYTWIGSNPSVLSVNANSISYQPLVRAVSAADSGVAQNGTHRSNQNIAVIVTDANGISAQYTQIISILAHPIIPRPRDGHATASYGCESPGEPEEWSQERVGWQQGMANTGGGSEAFCWLGDASWPGDYIRPANAGTLPASPWIYGDADYANWGINTANLVLVNGDGWPDGFTAMYPGAPQSAYNSTVDLYYPANPGSTMVLPIPTYPTYYNVNYNGSWGPIGPNDRLYWLAGLLCECLNPTDGGGLTPDQRWGPAFGGLHIFTGFASNAAYSAGAFPKAFAEDILGVNGSAQTIKDAWFNASTATNEGTAAAMGPITTGGVSDLNDYYIGKGTRGPTITGSAITGWWYLHQ